MADERLVEALRVALNPIARGRAATKAARYQAYATLAGLNESGYVLMRKEPSDADIEAMSRAYCFAGGCYACTDAADCGAWADFTDMRAAHAALVRGDDHR